MSDSFATPWTVSPAGSSCPRQEYWSGLPVPSPRDLSLPGTGPPSPALQVDSLLSHQGSPLCDRRLSSNTFVYITKKLEKIKNKSIFTMFL